MIVRLAIDMATYQYHDLTSEQLAAVRALLDGLSDCTVYPTGPLALGDEFMTTSGQTYQRMLEHKLTEKDNEIARRIEALTRAVNANGELTRKVADLIGDVALAKVENIVLKREFKEQNAEIERLRDELGSRHQIIVDQAGEIRQLRAESERLIAELDAARFAIPQPPPTQPPPPVYVPVPFYAQPYPPAWLWPTYTISCTTAGEIKATP